MINETVLENPDKVWSRLIDQLLGGDVSRQTIKDLTAQRPDAEQAIGTTKGDQNPEVING